MATATDGTQLPLPVEVELVGGSGNAFAILGTVRKALARKGYSHLVDEYLGARRISHTTL